VRPRFVQSWSLPPPPPCRHLPPPTRTNREAHLTAYQEDPPGLVRPEAGRTRRGAARQHRTVHRPRTADGAPTARALLADT
jgi:hypothetical protein